VIGVCGRDIAECFPRCVGRIFVKERVEADDANVQVAFAPDVGAVPKRALKKDSYVTGIEFLTLANCVTHCLYRIFAALRFRLTWGLRPQAKLVFESLCHIIC